jgi:hypothetical protein
VRGHAYRCMIYETGQMSRAMAFVFNRTWKLAIGFGMEWNGMFWSFIQQQSLPRPHVSADGLKNP